LDSLTWMPYCHCGPSRTDTLAQLATASLARLKPKNSRDFKSSYLAN